MPNLTKDCGCRQHDGPHWLHMSYVDARQNVAALQRAIDTRTNLFVAVSVFAENESRRLGELRRNMIAAGITSLADLPPALHQDVPSLVYPVDKCGEPHPAIAQLLAVVLRGESHAVKS